MINAIAIDDEPLAHKVIESFCNQTDFINLQKSFTKPNDALKHLRKFPADLLFVDIHMPGMTGINLVKALQQNTMVIFTTAFSEYAAVSYELNAIDYLLKPVNLKRFTQAVNKAKEYFNYIQKKANAADKYIFIRADFSLVKIPLTDIIYIEGLADYLKIHIKDRKTVVARMPMKDMLEKLPSHDFVRVHRSFILPFSKIESVRGNTISIVDRQIPIGKTYVEEFFKRYSE
ncbi:MAG TPA: LytTR family DNA-binding domain-containing protein [Chitinophagaceae bacterium]|jgi:DNA-binding LytR/AlgR family response regulator|nr:LytTR family DNA-binding domain-containing protein [Chitinophagaceae bacterium]